MNVPSLSLSQSNTSSHCLRNPVAHAGGPAPELSPSLWVFHLDPDFVITFSFSSLKIGITILI